MRRWSGSSGWVLGLALGLPVAAAQGMLAQNGPRVSVNDSAASSRRMAWTPPQWGSPGTTVLSAEGARGPLVLPRPVGTLGAASAMRTFHDRSYKVSFEFPANWTFAEKDHEISTFRLDARTAAKKTTLRAVAALPSNPYPASTFTGAYVYLSVTPHSNEGKCAAQASPARAAEREVSTIAGLPFTHGHDEQKHICTVERDEIYTTYRKGACYRFDLAMNNFCGGEVSGVKDVTAEELEAVRARLKAIVETVRFDPK